jgi:PAS domain S-box-containing protein
MNDVNQERTADKLGTSVLQISKPMNKSRDILDLSTNEAKQIQGRHSPTLGLIITIMGIAIADIIAMVIVYYFLYLPYYQLILLETVILILIIIPLLYVSSLRPLLLQIKQRQISENIIQTRLQLMQYANVHSLDELLEFSLNEIESLTGSTISFFHFLNADQRTISLQAWSTNTLNKMCQAEGKGSHYDLEKAGVWADAVRQRRPVLHNNYSALSNRKGLPEGHAEITREMVIPILRDDKVVGILGLGNKPRDFTTNDVRVVSTYADFTWDIVEHKQAENAIHKSEEKFRTLVDWTYDWEQWVDPQGNIVYISPSCERVSGYTPAEFIHDPKLIFQIVHPDDRQAFEEHQKVNHDISGAPITIEYRIIAHDGTINWLEHICRPLFASDGQHLGRRISNRDITERKHIEKMISEQNQKELALTQTIRTLQTDIGRDLHDTLGNQISFLRMNLEHLSETQWSDPVNIKNQIQNMAMAANESYEMIRAMLAILQTDNLAEPLSLFTRHAAQIADRSSFQSDITSQGEPKQLSLHQIRQLFYIFQEALGNIEKYANAKQVCSKFIWEDNTLRMVITDDGVGFDLSDMQKPDHYGLKFMQERAEQITGSLNIQSALGQGTTITVVVPYESELVGVPEQ